MKIRKITTIPATGIYWEEKELLCVKDDFAEDGLICVFPEKTYQEIDGFGGAFTEAAGLAYSCLSDDKKKQVLEAYFGKDGLKYNFCRTHINSCDFSLGNYSYIDEGDETLFSFDISRDKKYLLPLIKDSLKIGMFHLFASPWSPPAFMKTNQKMNEGGALKKKYYLLWAKYFGRYIDEYKKEGINIYAVTAQNEPKATQSWDSCVYTAEEERNFICDYLYPEMQKRNVEIYCWDHNAERICTRSEKVIEDNFNNKIAGLAFHWYSGDHFEQLMMFKEKFPDKKLRLSECCLNVAQSRIYNPAEKYAHEINGIFNAGANSFTDWNLYLDEHGGVNHLGNYCYAPIKIDTQKKDFQINDCYYYIGHYSRYIFSKAVRIGMSRYTDKLDCFAAKNPDGLVVVVVLNREDRREEANIKIGDFVCKDMIAPHSIATYLIREK